MPDTERQKLDDHQAISETTVQGGCSMLLGLPLAACGVFIVLFSLDVIPSSDRSFSAPRWVAALLGGVFALAGASFLLNGVAGLWSRARKRMRLTERPGERWRADHSWNPAGIRDRIAKLWTRYFWVGTIFVIFLTPFNWIAFWSGEGNLLWWFVVGVFDLVTLLIFGYGVYLLSRYLKYGTSYLRFGRFPFFLGQTLRATLTTKRPVPGLAEMTVVLRCVEERYETRRVGRSNQSEVVSYQVWADSVTESQLGALHQRPVQLEVSFELPEGEIYATALCERPARYWELEAHAETPGVDYRASFLVPIYAHR